MKRLGVAITIALIAMSTSRVAKHFKKAQLKVHYVNVFPVILCTTPDSTGGVSFPYFIAW